jgi:hypothetical protein
MLAGVDGGEQVRRNADEAHLFVRGGKVLGHGRSERSVQDQAGRSAGSDELVREQVGKDPARSVGAVCARISFLASALHCVLRPPG